jgi:hypothetical protein
MDTDEATFSWKLGAYEYHGNLWLSWVTQAPFRAQQGQIRVYNDGFPNNPQDDSATWTWDNDNAGGWDTGLRWGIGWNCAWIAERSPNGPYDYVVKLTTDATMGPDVARE